MFTFKTTKPTGRHASFQNSDHVIKIKKKLVGLIADKTWDIRLMAIKSDINEDGNANCDWKWIRIKYKASSLQDAKDYLKNNFDVINIMYNLKKLD